ncbi:hypothetical protein FNV43_RR02583 [Rhamnella rubrinervis]|uniref:Uncharacterized protein n=1 Tax=Rhamnella rubrinervis TaxID=2594499 RepID=A0A8K0HRQ4_9ROSA|nr:hypothetical protein FNV43_RR02583 [Rhamnella rubrinervis]
MEGVSGVLNGGAPEDEAVVYFACEFAGCHNVHTNKLEDGFELQKMGCCSAEAACGLNKEVGSPAAARDPVEQTLSDHF